MNNYTIVLFVACGFVVGFALAFLIKGKMATRRIQAAKEEAVLLIKDAKRRSATLLKEAQLEAKDRLFKMKSEFDTETKETRSDLKRREQRLLNKEETLKKNSSSLKKGSSVFPAKRRSLSKRTMRLKNVKRISRAHRRTEAATRKNIESDSRAGQRTADSGHGE